MISSKKWVINWFLILIIFSSSLIGVNYIVDPLGILHTNFLKQDHQLNDRFIKLEFLTKNKNKYNSYLFGSSAIGDTSPKVLEKYIKNSKFYNLTLSAGNLKDSLIHLNYFIDNNFIVDNLYLQIDISNINFVESDLGYLRKYYPPVINKSLNRFYLEYLVSFQPRAVLGKIKKNFNGENKIEKFFYTTGIWKNNDAENKIKENCEDYVEQESTFHSTKKRFKLAKNTINSLKTIKKIVKLSNENNIKLHLFITPINKVRMDTYRTDDYLEFIAGISEITNFYNFSGYNSVTINNCNYYTHTHYRPLVGEYVAAKIFKNKSIIVPDDFGVYVTKENIDEHLKILKGQIKSYDLAKKLSRQTQQK